MWEIDIIIGYRYKKLLLELKENITNSPNYENKGVFALIRYDNTAILSIAMVEPNNKLKDEIKTWIAECLVYSEKDSYIRSKKVIPNNEHKNALLKALVMVDIDKDVEYIRNFVNLDEPTINLHSLFKFKLSRLTDNWSQLLDKYTFNDGEITETKLVEVLQSLVNSKKATNNVAIKFNGKRLSISSENMLNYADDEADLVAQLILLNPSKITIHTQLKDETLTLLKYLFDNKLEIV